MPMTSPEEHGSNADGSANADYCCFCFKDGAFASEMTMEQMIDHCVQYLDGFNSDAGLQLTREQAVAQMREHFPTLKRWAGQ